MPEREMVRLGSILHVQVPGGFLQLAKVVRIVADTDGRPYVLVRWIDVRRDAEWLPASVVPPHEPDHTLQEIINSVGKST